MVDSASCSLAKECKRLYDEDKRVNSIKERSKNKKREGIQIFKKGVNYLQDKNDDVVMAGIKKEYIGFRKGNRNGISSMYNIRCDPKLGVGKADVRRIPCACSFCIE